MRVDLGGWGSILGALGVDVGGMGTDFEGLWVDLESFGSILERWGAKGHSPVKECHPSESKNNQKTFVFF